MAADLNVISLGAGVQSTTMALMAAHGEITPMPDCAIFADTGWEPKAVYDHLRWLMSPNVLPFPVHIVSAGSLREKVLSEGFSDVPWFTSEGMGRRQCTKVFKLYPIRDKAKELCGVSHGRELSAGAISMWIGISTNEAVRMKPSTVQYIENRWPLIEKRMNRWDCVQWLWRFYETKAPSSACTGCPFLSDEERRQHTPTEHADNVYVDAEIRNRRPVPQYMHRSLKPLSEVDLSTAEDRGQINMFGNECEGMCGV